ncbi:L-lactate dehydrogenase complex protein LldG [Silvibacterium bohemicum]|uniref:L-lactate dehydrogenase complex protein LldG n=1 Tax=Silvibacterium bohemicum TaxID=1577686 RepID=A0A841JVD1_9BACT|nr:LUD domain-containing protein [Silvibacterium bohemicum]MBB6145353.1 L-lactate dehydrogenase complex protein LldG [Silvibacterium bohemicum]
MPERTEARAQILERIRAAKPQAPPSDAAAAWEKIRREYKVAPDLPPAEILHLLEDRLRDYDAQVFHCVPAEIAGAIARALQQRDKQNIVIAAGTPNEWLPPDFHFVEDSNLDAHALDQLDGVLTGATLAIADTGTIVLQNVPGQGRRASTLMPDYHLCVLFASQVLQSVPQAMRMLEQTATLPTTFFSGPSATADIEMTRIKGVHGPRFLDVILVQDIVQVRWMASDDSPPMKSISVSIGSLFPNECCSG